MNAHKALCYWAAIYNQLNYQHQLQKTHNIGFDEFIKQPEHYQHAIAIYFSNPALFINRRNGTSVILKFFLTDPDGILMALLMGEAMRDEFEPDVRELLPKQSVAAAMVWWTDSNQDERISWFGDRYMERFHHHFAPQKYKTRGGHKKHRMAA